MDPSLASHVKKADYSIINNSTKLTLLALEAKSCKHKNKPTEDLIKAAKYLKEILDIAQKQGHTDLQLVALMGSMLTPTSFTTSMTTTSTPFTACIHSICPLNAHISIDVSLPCRSSQGWQRSF